jgi:rare lipoprotein A
LTTICKAGFCAALAACTSSTGTHTTTTASIDPELGVAASPVVIEEGEAAPSGGGRYHVGKRYQVAGNWYTPDENPKYDRQGKASWYGKAFHGRLTANGEVFDANGLTAAHPTLPLPSYVRVTNLENNRSLMVRVNDRGPFRHKRLIDVSEQAAELLGFRQDGTASVRVQYVDRAPLAGEDEKVLLASFRVEDRARRKTDPAPVEEPGVMLAAAGPPEKALAAVPENPVVVAAAEPAAKKPAPKAAARPVVLASAAAEPPSPQAVAFAPPAPEPPTASAGAAVEALTIPSSADDRIALAFTLIGEYE